jgi:flagellar biosynthetic protein FlhB
MRLADSSKTEKATPKKREDERKKGNIFQSADVVSALSILVLFLTLRMTLPYFYTSFKTFLTRYFGYGKTMQSITIQSASDVGRDCMTALFTMAGPALLASVAIAIVGTGLQTRFKFSHEQLKVKFSRLSPIQGIKRMFSLRSVAELVKSLIKIAVLFYVLYSAFRNITNSFTKLMYEDVMQAVVFILQSIMDIVLQLSIAFIGIAALDYLYQWWEYERSIRMSKQDLKEEYKQLEGDPLVKGQIRERQRKISMQRMMQQVPTADVIVRNPTHFAVALRYDIEKDPAPVVVAKGQDYTALRIVEIAERCRIPMTENKPLARALYRDVKVNSQVPSQYYVVLAQIMAWVYSMKRSSRS